MITFDCPNCGKPLIVPNSRAGASMTCTGCQAPLTAPQPRPPSKTGRNVKALLWFLVALAVAGAGYFRWQQSRRPMRIQEQFSEMLNTLSKEWKGINWDKCNSDTGEYKVSVFYYTDKGKYHFHGSCYVAVGRSFVVVDPTSDPSRWLANAVFVGDELESYQYQGGVESEKQDLASLSRDLASALWTAVHR